MRALRYDPAGGRNRVVLLGTPLGLDGVGREVAESLRSARGLAYEKKEEYLRKLDGVVRELDQRIEDLEDRVADKSEAVRREHAGELRRPGATPGCGGRAHRPGAGGAPAAGRTSRRGPATRWTIC